MSRYAELMYIEDASGQNAMSAAVQDVEAGALAYDTIPLSTAGRLSPFSPEFQFMTLEKGAMIFHMLRWEVGDEMFKNILKGVLTQYAGKPVRSADFIKVAETVSGEPLTPFFAQWLDGTGAPLFVNKFTVYRLGNNKGFRTIGEIGQDLDLFRMPVELRVETDGKTETKRIDVVGTESQYVVDTFGRPRRITIDPHNWVLKNSPDMQVRVSILRGQQMVASAVTPTPSPNIRKLSPPIRKARSPVIALAKCSSCSVIIRPQQMLIATPCAETANPDGLRFGVTSSSAKSSTLPDSGIAPWLNTARRFRRMTIRRAL